MYGVSLLVSLALLVDDFFDGDHMEWFVNCVGLVSIVLVKGKMVALRFWYFLEKISLSWVQEIHMRVSHLVLSWIVVWWRWLSVLLPQPELDR